MDKKQRLNVDIPSDLFIKMKVHTVEKKISITDYIIKLLEKDLKKSK